MGLVMIVAQLLLEGFKFPLDRIPSAMRCTDTTIGPGRLAGRAGASEIASRDGPMRDSSSLRRSVRAPLVCIAIAVMVSIVTPARSCGFEDGSFTAVQRGMLNWVYPRALYVRGAAGSALQAGLLQPRHFTRQSGLFAFHRTVDNMRRLAARLGEIPDPHIAAFSMVLLEPMLWTEFESGPDGVQIRPHASGARSGAPVVVTDVPVVAALVSGDISGDAAVRAGLLRLYGDAGETERIRLSLIAAFPGPDTSAIATNPRTDAPID